MNYSEIIKNLEIKNIIRIEKKTYEQSNNNDKCVKEVDTNFAGKICLLKAENKLIAREEDGKGSIYFRLMKDEEDFDAFTQDRLVIYDRMWDGCGCKVVYNEIWQKK